MNSEDFRPSASLSDDRYEDVPDDIAADEGLSSTEDGSTEDALTDEERDEITAARQAFEMPGATTEEIIASGHGDSSTADADSEFDAAADDPALIEMAQPFVGRWNQLVSTTNWEKGRIIAAWRSALIESGAPATHYSDEAWVRRVGGVTSPHVGRLRRVYERFGSTQETYEGVYWSHFLAALDWDDAPLWLEGAARESWSVAAMREMRWQAHGAVDSQRPTNSQIVEVDLDEDVVLPAQGGGRDRSYDDEADDISVGPIPEGPDFGDGEELQSLPGGRESGGGVAADDPAPTSPVQPFVGLPKLPDDLSDAVETMKLSILRHKSGGWRDVDVDDVARYLDALGVMLRA